MANNRKPQDGLYPWSRGSVFNFKKGLSGKSKYDDPTYLGFVFLFDWWSPAENNHDGGSPLLAGSVDESTAGPDPSSWTAKKGTAMHYLKACGEFQRMKYLNAFINTLKTINYELPWYWQSLEGVDQAWKYGGFEDPYIGGEDAKITINCLEAIDLKMTMLMDLYRKACYDLHHRRIMIPENLRIFKMWIWIQEIRKFQIAPKPSGDGINTGNQHAHSGIGANENDNPNAGIGSEVGDSGGNGLAGDLHNNPRSGQTSHSQKERDTESVVNNKSPYIFFELHECEFEPDESVGAFESLNMGQPGEAIGQKLVINYHNIYEPGNIYPFLAYKLGDTHGKVNSGTSADKNVGPNIEGQTTMDSNAKPKTLGNAQGRFTNNLAGNPFGNTDNAQDIIETAGTNIQNQGVDAASGFTNQLILGNVHGVSGTDIASALEQGSVQSLGSEFSQSAQAVNLGGSTDQSLPGNNNVHD